jgi:hypothetical protein
MLRRPRWDSSVPTAISLWWRSKRISSIKFVLEEIKKKETWLWLCRQHIMVVNILERS